MPNSDGEVRVEITGDSSKIKKELKETEAAVQNTTTSISEMTDALEDTSGTGDNLKEVADSAEEAAKAVSNVSTAAESFENITENADSAAKSISKAATETDSLGDSIKDEAQAAEKAGNAHGNSLNPQIKETGNQAEKSGDKVSSFSKKLEAAAKIAKAGAAVMGAAATGISAIAKAAVENYGEYEQLVGGVETLFKDSADVVQGYAANAYKTAGLSANQYMETVTSFSASLLQSLGGNTKAAAQAADKAIRDMADNANKMGTDMQSIQNAYQGFAKSNYTMLDNLKLGYGGTKEEMQRLLEDAEKFSGIKYDLSSYADVVEAIHVIQEEMGIAGTTAKEAATTIQGSLFSVKAAWQNLVTGIADENADFDMLIKNFVNSAATALENLLPRVKTSLKGIGKLVKELSPVIAQAIPELVSDVSPEIVQAAVDLIDVLVKALTDNDEMVVNAALDILDILVNALKDNAGNTTNGAVEIIIALINGISERLPDLIPAAVDIIAEIAKGITDNAADLFVAALKLIQALAVGLVKAVPELLIGVDEVCDSVYDSFVNFDWNSIGGDIINSICTGMINSKQIFNDTLNGIIMAGAKAAAALTGRGGISTGGSNYGGGGQGGQRAEKAFDTEQELEELQEYGETYAEYMERTGKQQEAENKRRQEQRLSDYEENLKAQVAEYDSSLALRQISEEEYWQEVGKYLSENKNLESKAYFELLEKYEDYLDKKQKAAEKAAKEQQEAEKKRIENSVTALKDRLEADKTYTKEMYYNDLEALISTLDKESDLYKKYYSEILKGRRDLADAAEKQAQQEAKKLLSEQEKIVEKSLSNILKTFQKAYNELDKKRENYRKKLLSVGGDLFSVDEIENPDGTKTKRYTVNNIEEQIKKMRQYNADVAKLKKQGVSSALLEELTSLSDGDSQQFASFLSGLSAFNKRCKTFSTPQMLYLSAFAVFCQKLK